VADAKLKTLYHTRDQNHHHPNAVDIYLYRESAVRRLAYMLHGGYVGHQAWVEKSNERRKRAMATRVANGTSKPRVAMPHYTYHDYEF